MAIATKIYRHEGIASPDTNQTQEALRRWWNNASALRINGSSEYEALKIRKLLRDGAFTVTASKRRGYIVLMATQK